MIPFHQKRKVTYNELGHAHFLTYSCHKRLPLLSKDRSCWWVIDAIREARATLDFALWAYVIMPEHVHLIVHPRQKTCTVARILGALKRPVSVQAKGYLMAAGQAAWLQRLTVTEGSQTVFRFWQPGGGYDKNLWHERPIEAIIDYIHENPIRRGMVGRATDWYWSSARYWEGDRSGPLEMDPLDL